MPYLRLADSPPSSGTRLHLRHRSVALLNAPLSTLFSTDINEVRLKLSEKFGATPLPPSTTADGVKLRKDLIMKAAPNGYCLLQLLSYYDRRLYSVSAADIVCIGIFIPCRVDVIVEVAGVSSLVSEGLSVLRFGVHYGTFLARSLPVALCHQC